MKTYDKTTAQEGERNLLSELTKKGLKMIVKRLISIIKHGGNSSVSAVSGILPAEYSLQIHIPHYQYALNFHNKKNF